jgi:hypothetical protein
MGRLEVSCRRFAILSGAAQDPADHAICVHPGAPGLQRKGTLAVITEAAGSYPALDVEACRLAQRVVVESYFADSALSLTSSLLNALDHANAALLQYNYTSHDMPPGGAGEAMQGDGAKAPDPAKEARRYQRRAKVGATALLIRPDGAGIYLSQMAPTQAYVYHNGMLSAIPEPAAWKAAPQQSLAVMSGAAWSTNDGATSTGLEDEEDLDEAPETNVPAPSLGSGPGVEADLVYRRISAGDIVVVLSTSLARHLDRDRIEHLLSRYDADNVISALRGIAIDNGLAEAHACVLELGVLDSSGVEKRLDAPAIAQNGHLVAEGRSAETGGVMAAQHGPRHLLRPTFKEVLRGPREWLQRRKLEPEQADASSDLLPVEFQASDTEAESSAPLLNEGQVLEPQFSSAEDEEQFWSKQPTELFPQRPIDIPPYRAAQDRGAQGSSPAFWEDEDDQELHFDGWEDAPPALDFPLYEVSHRVLFKPTPFVFQLEEEQGASDSIPTRSSEAYRAPRAPVPPASSPLDRSAHSAVLNPQTSPRLDIRGIAGSAGNWLVTTTRSLIPDQRGTSVLVAREINLGKTLPMRWVIGGALVIAGLLFILSVMSMAGNSQKAATQNILQEAQQMETLANQPGLLAADRLQKLQLALDKAQAAAAASPQSPDARLLATKIQNELDQAQGITRFASAKLLFDLDAIDKSSTTGSASSPISTTSTTVAQGTVSGTLALPLNDIFLQGNDVYILDRTSSKLYRCQIAAATCLAVLKSGDSAGGQQVGTLVAMTMRVGSPVLLDDKLVSYALSTDTGAWQAQPLGDATSLQAPKDIASFDGNLYLLGAKPGQISKYPSGQYDQTPLNWIQDQPTGDAMKAPAAIAIDGEIYVALADGKILTMQAGKLDQILTPKTTPEQSAPTRLYTNTDVKDLYLLRADDGTITHISKAGDVIATLKAPAGMGLDKLSGMAVDEARGIYYLVEGRKVFQATLAAPVAPAPAAPAAPTVHPTIAP